MYDEVDGRLPFSLASLEASSVCSPDWILSPESIPPPTIDTREGFSFSVMSSSTSAHFIAPVPGLVFFRLAYLALVADYKSSHFFLSCSLVLGGNPAATNWLRTSKHVCIFNLNVSVGDKVPNRVIFLFFTSWRRNLTSSVLKFEARFLGLEPCSSAEFRFIDILESCALISCGNREFMARFNNSRVKMVANY